MVVGSLKIHTENILPIIKKWLYSDKDIFVRELVSNACDALHKCKTLREHGLVECTDEELRIHIRIDKAARTLTFADTGLGMTAEEVEKYIAQVAFSGAEEFVSKYQSSKEGDQIIGHFGLGFYSSYMVAQTVTIDTLSYKAGATPALWTCDGSATYTLDTGARTERGTTITLSLDKESDEFLDEAKIRSILQQHCAFLPFPIYLGDSLVNKKEPLWLKNPSECTDAEYLDFYKALYPLEPEPIFWIHLSVDYPFHLKGILYFPKVVKNFDFGKNAIKLFCNRVFICDSCKDLVPDYLMVLRGALDSPDIPLNVSRSTLQMDRTVRQLSTHIAKKVADRLSSLCTLEKERFLSYWSDIELIVKLGMLQDEKFYEKTQEILVWKNTKGEWISLSDYRASHPEGKVFYTTEEASPLIHLYKEKGIEVLVAASPLDVPLMNFLEDKIEKLKFQRIDGALDDALLDSTREKTLLDAEGKTESARIASLIRSQLDVKDLEIEAKSLQNDKTPGFLVIDEEMRRFKEAMALSRQSLPLHLPGKKTFIVNTNSKLVQAIYKLQDKNPSLSKELAVHLYELALLSQKEMEPALLPGFIARSSQLLEAMTEHL